MKLRLTAVVKQANADMAGWLGPDGSYEDVAGPGGHLTGAFRIGKHDGFEVPTSQGYEAAYQACYAHGYFRVTAVESAADVMGNDIQANWFTIKRFILRHSFEFRDSWVTLVDEKNKTHWRFTSWAELMQGPK
jgi:hypothetical protein